MKNILAHILSLVTAVGIAASSTAQEIEKTFNPQDDVPKSSAAVRRESQLVISVTLNGDQFVNRVECIAIADPLEEYSLLRLEPVRDELGLEKSFQSKMSSATKKADDTRREMLVRMWGAGSAQTRAAADQWFQEQQSEVLESIAELLEPAQEERLAEIRQRMVLRLNGWPAFFRHCQKEGLIDWELNERELAALTQSASRIKKEVLEESIQLHAQLLEQLFAELDEKQVETTKRIALKLTGPTGALDLFRAQLILEENNQALEAKRGPGAEESLFNRIRRPLYYMLGEDGGLVRFKLYTPNNLKFPLQSDHIEWHADLLESLRFGDLGRQIGISESQSEQLLDSILKISSFRDQAREILENSENPILDNENVMDMQVFVQENVEQSVNELLSKEQLKKLEVVANFADLARMGLLTNLVNGPVGKELEVTRAQKENLRKFADAAGKQIDTLARKLENRCWQELASQLDREHRSDLARLLGDPPQKMTANFNLLLDSLSELEKYNRKNK